MTIEDILKLPGKHVFSVIGAGGKTTVIHHLAEGFCRQRKKVLVTTTTHMLEEEDLKMTEEDILSALERGYAFAGTREIKNGIRKISSLPEDVLKQAIDAADITLIEADGARCLPFKVPKETEPVIMLKTTEVILIAGMTAVGSKVREVCYNAEALCKVLSCRADDVLTVQMMAEAYRRTYLCLLPVKWPHLPVYILPGQIHDKKSREDGELFLRLLTGSEEE